LHGSLLNIILALIQELSSFIKDKNLENMEEGFFGASWTLVIS